MCECFVSRSVLERRQTGRFRCQVGAPVTPSRCPELRELEFSVLQPTTRHRATVSSYHLREHPVDHIFTPLDCCYITSPGGPHRLYIFYGCISAFADELRGSSRLSSEWAPWSGTHSWTTVGSCPSSGSESRGLFKWTSPGARVCLFLSHLRHVVVSNLDFCKPGRIWSM